MKKLLALAMIAGSIGFSSISAEARTSEAKVLTANTVQTMQTTRIRRNGRIVRTVTRTRNVRVGRQRYRETYRITYLPNGRTRTQIISRIRIR